MMRARSLILVAFVISCRVPALDGTVIIGPTNTCDLGCGTAASCVDGQCIGNQTAYPLFFEVTPPKSATFAPGVTFTINALPAQRDLTLDEPARVVAELLDAKPIPLTLRLRRADALPGAARAVFEATSFVNSTVTPALTIPQGDYEVFVAPANDDDLAALPPVQLRDDTTGGPLIQTFAAGSQKLSIAYAGGLRTIDVTLTDVNGVELTDAHEGRDVYVIDQETGLLASTIAHTCGVGDTKMNPNPKLTLAPALAGHRYTLRAAPAACLNQHPIATVDFDLQSLDVEGHGNRAELKMPPYEGKTLTLYGQVSAFGTNTPIFDATVLFRSQALSKDVDAPTGRAWVELQADVRAAGIVFIQNALPGTYRAVVVPGSTFPLGQKNGSRQYAICTDCSVTDPMGAAGARVVDFPLEAGASPDFQIAPRVPLTMSAAGFDGGLFALGTFEADSSSSAQSLTALGTPLTTRSEQGAVVVTTVQKTNKTFNVSVALDPGSYDLIVRTPERSGYPWIVLPRVDVQAPSADLGVVKAPAPVVYAGRVLDPKGNPVPRATVRARGKIVDAADPKNALGAVLVAETRADDDGNYRLMVPVDFATRPPATTK